ncbi:MAG: hypothetical protein ACYTFK_10000 [Planctomycetota bacterium]|jgi:hypothetical protein
MKLVGWLKKRMKYEHRWKVKDYDIKWYPNSSSCVGRNMSNVSPQQMPPLMVRKAAWRR